MAPLWRRPVQHEISYNSYKSAWNLIREIHDIEFSRKWNEIYHWPIKYFEHVFIVYNSCIKNIANGHKLRTSIFIDPNFNYTPSWVNQPNKHPNHNPHLLCDQYYVLTTKADTQTKTFSLTFIYGHAPMIFHLFFQELELII